MAVLTEDDLISKAESRAGFRLHVAATKLSQSEAQRFAALAKKRGRKRGDLLRQLILSELARDEATPPASAELTEIVGLRLLLTNAQSLSRLGRK